MTHEDEDEMVEREFTGIEIIAVDRIVGGNSTDGRDGPQPYSRWQPSASQRDAAQGMAAPMTDEERAIATARHILRRATPLQTLTEADAILAKMESLREEAWELVAVLRSRTYIGQELPPDLKARIWTRITQRLGWRR